MGDNVVALRAGMNLSLATQVTRLASEYETLHGRAPTVLVIGSAVADRYALKVGSVSCPATVLLGMPVATGKDLPPDFVGVC